MLRFKWMSLVLSFSALLWAVCAAPAQTTLVGLPSAGPRSPQQVTVSTGGMDGLKDVWVQTHIAGGADWKELVGLDEETVRKRVEEHLRSVPGLTLAGRAPAVPRVQVIVVGHLIADDEGRKVTAATSLAVNLSQQVAVRRKGAAQPTVTTGATWQRSLLITGLKDSMRQRVNDKLTYLLDQFRQDYLRVNPGEETPASG